MTRAHLFVHGTQKKIIHMKIVAALTDPARASRAEKQGADMVELRFDLMEGDPLASVQTCRDVCSLPIIATLRSAQEGGQFFGDAVEWFEKIRPLIPLVDYVDIEQRFSSCAPLVKEAGKTIIASHHSGEMMSLPDLFILEHELRRYGDIVKIIVTPGNREDIIELIVFTHAMKRPVCTGILGARFRYARAILPLFGSELVYCHVGTATAAGQYSVQEFVRLLELMKTVPGPSS
jgi:3-dehydroquinate dehydratase-1